MTELVTGLAIGVFGGLARYEAEMFMRRKERRAEAEHLAQQTVLLTEIRDAVIRKGYYDI